MNHRRVLHILSWVLLILAVAQLIPVLWCLDGANPASLRAFLIGASTTAGLGLLF
jgi:hypothetical protein